MRILEKDMEDLIIEFPEKYLKETGLKLISRQYVIGKYRFDLLFEDRHQAKLIVELQRGTLDRNHTYKILDYYDEYKKQNPDEFIDLMIVANKIPRERRDRLNSYGISFHEIPESLFLDEKLRLDNRHSDNSSSIEKNNFKEIEFEIVNSKESQLQKLSIKQKVLSIFCKKNCKIYSIEDIKNEIIKKYPETNPSSIIPSDYCYNIWNKGIKFDFHLFDFLGDAQYKCLGENYPYNGNVYWKEKPVGQWENGKFYFFKNSSETKTDIKYGKYGQVALIASSNLKDNSPKKAWELATLKIFPNSQSSRKKNCPRSTFLGLCEEGLIQDSKPGHYLTRKTNKEYALNAIQILKSEQKFTSGNDLWKKALNGKVVKYNYQMDVVLALWKNNRIL